MNKEKAGYLVGSVSVLTNLLLFILKLWAGIVTGSIAITADAWHTLSDSLSSIIVIIAVKLSARKPDRKHPFGHGRWEQIAALFIGFLLAVIAYDFLRDAIVLLRTHEATQFGTIAIVVTAISVVVKEALAQYAFYVARRTHNVAIKADAWHHRTDALSSGVLLLGILVAKKFWWIDGVLGIIIALMIFWATYTIIKEAITKLLGEEPSEELKHKIRDAIDSVYDGNAHPHHFHLHNYVSHQELTFHIKLSNTLDIESGHKIATDIESKIFEAYGIISTIHVEPLDFVHERD